jgi:PIN domain nuclease of toxin-antitoxin system
VIVLDTHVLLWADSADRKLGRKDRFIAACALVNGATLVTAEERVLAWQHALPRHDATT